MNKEKIHLLCSTNWPPNVTKPEPADITRMLGPFKTISEYITRNQRDLSHLTLIGEGAAPDFDFARELSAEIHRTSSKVRIQTAGSPEDTPSEIAAYVSSAAETAKLAQAKLLVDLTPGPKHRSAALFAAASAIPEVEIVYAESKKGSFEIKPMDRLSSYNRWLGRHGIQIRNYCEELAGLAQNSDPAEIKAIQLAISDFLGPRSDYNQTSLSIRSNLLILAEKTGKTDVPVKFFNRTKQGVSEQDWDAEIRDAKKDEWKKSTGRAGQLVYQLRCLIAHGDRQGRQLDEYNFIALLDCLAFIVGRSNDLKAKSPIAVTPVDLSNTMFIAVDGDDIGRRFEEHLANCVYSDEVEALCNWGKNIQLSLSAQMLELQEKWDAMFLARTGDGFLASFQAEKFSNIKNKFRPRLGIETVTTGIGRTVKDAYLALKLGKARNRGGGFFFSLNPSEEKILWKAQHVEAQDH